MNRELGYGVCTWWRRETRYGKCHREGKPTRVHHEKSEGREKRWSARQQRQVAQRRVVVLDASREVLSDIRCLHHGEDEQVCA